MFSHVFLTFFFMEFLLVKSILWILFNKNIVTNVKNIILKIDVKKKN